MCHVWKSIQIINLILVTISGNRSDRIRYNFVLMWRKFYSEISYTHHFTFQEILCVFKAHYILCSHWTVIISHVSLFGLVIGQTLMLSEGRHPLASSVDAIATYLRNLKPSLTPIDWQGWVLMMMKSTKPMQMPWLLLSNYTHFREKKGKTNLGKGLTPHLGNAY